MPTRSDDHDHLAWRLTAILLKLNQGEHVVIDRLAEEFGVHPRTIRRDLHERFAFLPLNKEGDGYRMDAAYLGKLTFADIERFAQLAGLSGLFPVLDAQFFRELFDSRIRDTFTVHGHHFEDISHRLADFRLIQQAIIRHQPLRFTYTKTDQTKTVRVHPYKLISHAGVWYLAATDGDQMKAYSLAKISALDPLPETFTPEQRWIDFLAEEESIWLNAKNQGRPIRWAPDNRTHDRIQQ